MKLKILKNEHYIDIVNECDFQEGSTAFTASCFLNKNIEGEFKDFSLTEENESIAKVLLCSFEMLEQLKVMFSFYEELAMKINSDDFDEEFRSKWNPIMTSTELLIEKATE